MFEWISDVWLLDDMCECLEWTCKLLIGLLLSSFISYLLTEIFLMENSCHVVYLIVSGQDYLGDI